MTILVRKVRAVDIVSHWIKEGWWIGKGLSRPRYKVASEKYHTREKLTFLCFPVVNNKL